MAKTKRRQLAALAAQAELKVLAAYNDRTSSADKSGPSRSIPPQTGDPMVEIRTQRVIFKIPALPLKPTAAADAHPLKIAEREDLGNGRRKKLSQTEINPNEQVPAHEAKLSRGIIRSAERKRHKKIRDLLPPSPGGKRVPPSSAELSNTAGQLSPVAKSTSTAQRTNKELPRSKAESQKPAKKTVQLLAGPRKRAKVQEADVRSEKDCKMVETQNRSKGGPTDGTLDRAPSNDLIMSTGRSYDLEKDTDKLQDLARASDGDLPRSLAHSPAASRKVRRGGSTKKVISQIPVSPRATVMSPHRTRSRLKISHCEAMALEVLQEIQNVKNISQHMEYCVGKIAEHGTRLVRRAPGADGEETAYVAGQDQSQQAEPQDSGNYARPIAQDEAAPLAHVGVRTVDSSSEELLQSGPQASYHTCSQGDDGPGDSKSLVHIEKPPMPIRAGKQGAVLVVPKQGKYLGKSFRTHFGGNSILPRGAERITRDRQLIIMEKRLEAAGGLRNWLFGKGLGQFVPLLEKWNMDNLSLMQLTMEGLKSMGLLPVGPRRKLIHAINSLTLPYFNKANPLNANPR